MVVNGKFVSLTWEKIRNYDLYRTYRAFMQQMQNNNMDLTYPSRYVDAIEEAIYRIPEIDKLAVECNDEDRTPQELDEIAIKNFRDIFNGPSMFIFRSLVRNKTIDPSFPFDASDLENRKIILKKYDKLSDLMTLFYEILHILIYQKNKKIAELELFPQAFKLIVADYLDTITKDGNFVTSTLSTQIEEFKYNNYINLLYPSLTPVILP